MTGGTSEQRLEACRTWVQAVLDYGDDLGITFDPKWMDGGCVLIWRSNGYANNGQPEPPHRHDFTRDELLAVLQPLGKVRDLRDKMPWHFATPWNFRSLGITAHDVSAALSSRRRFRDRGIKRKHGNSSF
jgi:hypothetical protein